MHYELEELERALAGRTTRSSRSGWPGVPRTVALHFDFVARPNGSRDLASELALTLEDARLGNEGLEASLLLVSDREARLVTLLTFWDARRFRAAREPRIAWMQKLLAPFADGSIRAHSSLPQFLTDAVPVEAAVKPPGLGERTVEQVPAQ